jgi:hypothetical protein
MERLRGECLKAQSLYDIAELIRRFGEAIEGNWPEEDDEWWGQPEVKTRLYGGQRVTDRNRTVLRRIVRRYGLDPQPRACIFVEGPTEVGFIDEMSRLAGLDLENQGVTVVSLEGVHGLRSRRLRNRLAELRGEECFPLIVIDADQDASRTLRQLEKAGLLPIEPVIWKTDFEEENFSVAELARVASAWSAEFGVQPVRLADVAAQPGKVIVQKLNRAFGPSFKIEKGEAWGRRLARWSARHKVPKAIADSEGNRPILTHLLRAYRAVGADYAATIEHREAQRAVAEN